MIVDITDVFNNTVIISDKVFRKKKEKKQKDIQVCKKPDLLRFIYLKIRTHHNCEASVGNYALRESVLKMDSCCHPLPKCAETVFQYLG